MKKLKSVFWLCFIAFGFSKTAHASQLDSLQLELQQYVSTCSERCLKDSLKINLLNAIGLEFSTNQPDSALFYHTAALDLSKKVKWTIGIGNSQYYLGRVYYFTGNYFASYEIYSMALKTWDTILADASSDLQLIVKKKKSATLINMASGFIARGDYNEALKLNLEALKLAEELRNLSLIAGATTNLGKIYREQKKYDQASKYYHIGLQMSKESNDLAVMETSLSLLGSLYKEQALYDSAVYYYSEALEISNRRSDAYGISRNTGNLGTVLFSQNKFTEALNYFQTALNATEESKDNTNKPIWLSNIGNTYFKLGKIKEAEAYQQEALKIYTEIGDLEGILDANTSLADLYIHNGNYKKGHEYYKSAMLVKDSIYNESNIEEMTQLKMQYDFDKKEVEQKALEAKNTAVLKAEIQKEKVFRNSVITIATISLCSILLIFFLYLRKRNIEQKQKETFLSLQVSETEMKALRSQMNPHFIFNALQSIQTFLINHKSDEANRYLLKFSKLMRAVLENSLQSEVSLKKDILALELYMQLESIRLPHPFTYYFHLDESIDPETAQIPPLILQPFVENAIWHGLQHKPGPGQIDIFIKKNGSELLATVEDNGVGRDMSRSVEKPMLINKESLGIKLTEERLKILNEQKKINAGFKITDLFTSNNHASGTRVDLVLPSAT